MQLCIVSLKLHVAISDFDKMHSRNIYLNDKLPRRNAIYGIWMKKKKLCKNFAYKSYRNLKTNAKINL